MPQKTLSASQYSKLKADLQQILQKVHKQGDSATSAAAVEGYWKIGERIAREKLANSAGYHNPILRDISEDIDIDLRSLQQMLRMHDLYRSPPKIPNLAWSQLRLLVGVSDDRERGFYEDVASHESWSARKLATAMRANRYLESLRSKNKNRIKLEPPATPDYRYSVEVRRVIDADTILVDVDLGFEILRRQSMRLARVDALERGTAQGELARRYVQFELFNAERVVIQTVKSDIHGRFLAHIFYTDRKLGIHATVTHGEYLNQKLLDRSYARAH